MDPAFRAFAKRGLFGFDRAFALLKTRFFALIPSSAWIADLFIMFGFTPPPRLGLLGSGWRVSLVPGSIPAPFSDVALGLRPPGPRPRPVRSVRVSRFIGPSTRLSVS